jgi:hypothetical protein
MASIRGFGFKNRNFGDFPRAKRFGKPFLDRNDQSCGIIPDNVGEDFLQGDFQFLLDEAKSGIKTVGLVFEVEFVFLNQTCSRRRSCPTIGTDSAPC